MAVPERLFAQAFLNLAIARDRMKTHVKNPVDENREKGPGLFQGRGPGTKKQEQGQIS